MEGYEFGSLVEDIYIWCVGVLAQVDALTEGGDSGSTVFINTLWCGFTVVLQQPSKAVRRILCLISAAAHGYSDQPGLLSRPPYTANYP